MKIDLETWYKPDIDKKTLKKLSRRKDWPALLHFIIYFLTLFIAGFLAYITWGSWLCILFFFIYGTIYSFSVSNWHETVHKTAFKKRWVNEIFYHISSLFIPYLNIFYSKKKVNRLHHRCLFPMFAKTPFHKESFFHQFYY